MPVLRSSLGADGLCTPRGLVDAFSKVDDELLADTSPKTIQSGACAVVAHVAESGLVTVAHAGDCRAIIGRSVRPAAHGFTQHALFLCFARIRVGGR